MPHRELEQWKRDPNTEDHPNLRGQSGYIHHGQDGGAGGRGGRGRGRDYHRGGGNAGGDAINGHMNNNRTNTSNQKIGTIRDNPDPSLQAKLKDNFDFSSRTLEESKNANATQ